MSTSALTTLGSFAFAVDGASRPGPSTHKSRALMAYLIMNKHVEAARDRLVDTFWPDAEPERARDSLKTALWSIRRCLRNAGCDADAFMAANKSTVRWTADTSVDASLFEDYAARDDSGARQEALQLYRGDFLEGDYDSWAVSERERLAALYENVLAREVRTSKDAGAAARFVARNPYDEDAYAALIEWDLTAGRRSAAATWVDRCRTALAEVGEKPSVAFEERFGNIVHVEPFVSGNPALPFTGRDYELGVIAAKLAAAFEGAGSLMLVHGEAGIGKSALLGRAARIASERGLRVFAVECAAATTSTFGPWRELFDAVGAGDLDTFVLSHASDLATAVAHAVVACLPDAVLLLVDDAHELSGDAFEIFTQLASALVARHAIVAALRPEGTATIRRHLTNVDYEELPLGGISRANFQLALGQALGIEQPDLFRVLYDRSGGHPLFFTGLLNSLVSAGVIARDGHTWQLTRPIDADFELPESIRRYIETRLQSRGEAPHVVAGALALEPAARAEDLGAVLRMDEMLVLDALDDLLALGLIIQPEAGVQFAFSHDLIREAAAAGLHAGRRAALHRAFAQRLRSSTEFETSLRLARHLSAAGETLEAAQTYLKAAQEALDLNAAQDASERCAAGVRAAEMLERSADRDLVLSKLHRTAGRAAICGGDVEHALRCARDAAAIARSGGNALETTRAILDLAAMEGATFQVRAQASDAEECLRSARAAGDESLEAQARIQQAGAARELGACDESLQAGRSAYALAIKCGAADVAQAALEEILRTQMTWWLFADALKTARAGLATSRRASALGEASFLSVHGAFSYISGRVGEARADLQMALRIAAETARRRDESPYSPMRSLPLLQFGCHLMDAKIAIALHDWDHALAAVERAAGLTIIAKLPHNMEALTLLRVDALLQRNAGDDSERARDLVSSLAESTPVQGTIGWSDCLELGQARAAARFHLPEGFVALRRALNALEENAHRWPLEADRVFSRLASSAVEAGETAIANRAHDRHRHYRARRISAATAAATNAPETSEQAWHTNIAPTSPESDVG